MIQEEFKRYEEGRDIVFAIDTLKKAIEQMLVFVNDNPDNLYLHVNIRKLCDGNGRSLLRTKDKELERKIVQLIIRQRQKEVKELEKQFAAL